MEKNTYVDGLTENEVTFIGLQDSFYMATVGENGYPYIQHRGGPKGFVKVLDANQIGFIDFSGNKQFISVGNLVTNNKAAIIMVDYPARTRLKLYAQAKIVELGEDADLYALLELKEYKSRPERMIVLHVDAWTGYSQPATVGRVCRCTHSHDDSFFGHGPATCEIQENRIQIPGRYIWPE